MTTSASLEALARGKQCAFCQSEPRVAWIQGYYQLRCNCHPQPPVLMKRPPSELTRALRDPNYPTAAVTRMQAERMQEKRGDL